MVHDRNTWESTRLGSLTTFLPSGRHTPQRHRSGRPADIALTLDPATVDQGRRDFVDLLLAEAAIASQPAAVGHAGLRL